MKKFIKEIKSWNWKRLFKHWAIMVGLQLSAYMIIIYFGGSIELMKPFMDIICMIIALDFTFNTKK